MASTTLDPVRPDPLHPVHAFFLAGTVPLVLGAVLSDWAYHDTAEIQWSNFASWLIAGGLVFLLRLAELRPEARRLIREQVEVRE